MSCNRTIHRNCFSAGYVISTWMDLPVPDELPLTHFLF